MSTAVLVRWVLVVLCVIIFCGSAGYLLLYGKDTVCTEKQFRKSVKAPGICLVCINRTVI